jgi:hypothetical protein
MLFACSLLWVPQYGSTRGLQRSTQSSLRMYATKGLGCDVYDFNCQEGEYMLNRVPEMFGKTRLFIDHFHATSHKCASTFKLQAYPVFQELVSTGSESLSLFLQRLHEQAPFTKQETFVAVVRVCAGLQNYMFNSELKKLAAMCAGTTAGQTE